jgi:hypothetical protein
MRISGRGRLFQSPGRQMPEPSSCPLFWRERQDFFVRRKNGSATGNAQYCIGPKERPRSLEGWLWRGLRAPYRVFPSH